MTVGRVLRLAPWVIIGLVVVVTLVIGAHRQASPESIDARARTIAAGVRCPTCAGESAADSQVYEAKAIRTDITRRLHAGQSDRQIRAYLVSRYGPGILESPPARGILAVGMGAAGGDRPDHHGAVDPRVSTRPGRSAAPHQRRRSGRCRRRPRPPAPTIAHARFGGTGRTGVEAAATA